MKLVQINCWQGKIAPKLLQFIAREKPDFITTQEIFDAKRDAPVPNRQFDLGRQIRETSGLINTFFAPRCSVDVADEEKPFGNMIFSRWPFADQKTIFVSGHQPIYHMKTSDDSLDIGINLQIVEVKIDDKTLMLANHHGYLARGNGERFGDEKSEESMRKVAEQLREFANRPLVLAGDMNVISESATMRAFDGFLHDLTAENQIQQTLSPIHWFDQPVACDHILVNDAVKVQNFAVRKNELVSDHLPLVLEFDI